MRSRYRAINKAILQLHLSPRPHAPDYPVSADDRRNLLEQTDIPVAMFVGEQNTGWIPSMQETADALAVQGSEVSLEIVPGEGHLMRSFSPDKLFALLDSFR